MNEKISASEVNKYLYCHYQWYYEKTYDRKHIMDLHKQRNNALGLTDSSRSNFVKGLKFHSEYKIDSGKFRMFKLLLLLVVILFILLICWYFGADLLRQF